MAKEHSGKSNSILVQGSILAAASLMVRFIGLIYRVPMRAILGPEAIGYYGSAYEFYNLALILSSYSLPLAVSKLVSARRVQGQHRNARKVFILALTFGAVVGAIGTCVCHFGAYWYGAYIDQPGAVLPLQVLAPTILVFSVMGVIRGYFQGYNNMVPTAISQVIEQIINAGVSVGAAYWLMQKYAGTDLQLTKGAAGGTFGTFMGAEAALLTLLIVYFMHRKVFQKLIAIEKENASESETERPVHILKLLVLTVVPVIVSQTVYQISGMIDNVVFNRVLLGRGYSASLRAEWWGIYTNEYKLLTNVPVAIASAMGTAIVPGLVAVYVKGHKDQLREKVASAVKFNMIIAFPCAAGMAVLSGPILRMLWGITGTLNRNILQLGSVAIIVFALSTLTNGILQGINHLSIPVLHSAIALVIHVIVLEILLQFTNLDVYALMICNVLFGLVVSILNWISIGHYLAYKQEIKTTFIIPFIASAFMGVSCRCLYDCLFLCTNVTISCVGAILLAVPVYFAALILLKGVSKEELLNMPKGHILVKILTKCRLLR
ncbi:MAG: polysaccharide biosynthesis protein [Lachnospiraceae bacterium]|nr:polysaccharide biosynthesis protein [Lachnospiraceae bacterium]